MGIILREIIESTKKKWKEESRMPQINIYRKKHLESDWVREVQYWPYLHSVFNICTLLLNNNKKNQHSISAAEK